MKVESIIYHPTVIAQFTRAEAKSLDLASRNHYDFRCREQSRIGGVIYGLLNRFPDDSDTAEVPLTSGEVDLLCKISESPLCNSTLHFELKLLVRDLNDKYKEINKSAA